MRTFNSSIRTEAKEYKQLGKRLAKLGFWFFLIKGLLWLAAPLILSYLAMNS